MTSREMLTLVNTELKQSGKARYITGTTSAVGAADGSTFVDTTLGGVDDAWNRAEFRLTSGTASGQKREIGDWVNSTGTGTFVDAFTHQVASGVTFEIGEKGFVTDHQIIEFLSAAQLDLGVKLPSDAFIEVLETKSVGSVAGVVAVPADILGVPHAVQVDGVTCQIIPPDKQDKFGSVWTPGTTNRPVGIFRGGNFEHRPANNSTVKMDCVPKFTDFSFSAGSALPNYLHTLQSKYAVWQGWIIKERTDLAQAAKLEYDEGVNSIINKYTHEAELSVKDR